MEEWPGSQDPQKVSYSLAHNISLSLFDHIATRPFYVIQFADSMSFLMNNPALISEYVFAYDWAKHSEGTVIDIGGISQRISQIK